MKKTVRNIIIMLAVLAVLGGAAFLLLKMPAEGGEEELSSSAAAESSGPVETVLSISEEDVESVEIRNSQGDYTAVPLDTGDGVSFTIKGYEGYGLENTYLTSNVKTLLNMTAAKNLGPQDNLEAFGLSGGEEVEATVNAKSGVEKLTLGKTAAETSGRYVLKDGNVYIATSVPANFYESMYVYFVKDIYTIADRVVETVDDEGNKSESAGEEILKSLTLSGSRFPEPIAIESSSKGSSGYLMTQPVTAESGNTAFNDLVASLKSLTASSVASADTSEESLKQYGLSEPEAEIQFVLNDSEHKLAVSAKDNDGNRYLLADNNGLIYQVANDQVSKWAEQTVLGLRMSYIWIPNIKNVEKVHLTVEGDQVYEYRITRTKNEQSSSSSDSVMDYDLTIVDADGNNVDYDDAYQPFYQKLIALAVFSMDSTDYGKDCKLRIEYEYFEGGGDTLEFYPIEGQNRYAALLNGQYNGQIRGSEMDALLAVIP